MIRIRPSKIYFLENDKNYKNIKFSPLEFRFYLMMFWYMLSHVSIKFHKKIFKDIFYSPFLSG